MHVGGAVIPRMTPSALTAWRPAKDGRSVSWTPLGSMRCRWDESRETTAGTSGDTASWIAELIIPSGSDEPPLMRGDRVALGERDGGEPTPDALTVTGCCPVHLGGARPHHWEATAR